MGIYKIYKRLLEFLFNWMFTVGEDNSLVCENFGPFFFLEYCIAKRGCSVFLEDMVRRASCELSACCGPCKWGA